MSKSFGLLSKPLLLAARAVARLCVPGAFSAVWAGAVVAAIVVPATARAVNAEVRWRKFIGSLPGCSRCVALATTPVRPRSPSGWGAHGEFRDAVATAGDARPVSITT